MKYMAVLKFDHNTTVVGATGNSPPLCRFLDQYCETSNSERTRDASEHNSGRCLTL